MKGLYLHCGSEPVELFDVATAPTPQATETHVPINHAKFLDTVGEALSNAGLKVDNQNYGLSHDGNRMFSLASLSRQDNDNGTFKNVLGIRNAHDKAFSAGLVCGSQVFVCDNLAFSGEIKMNRKHTVNIMRDLPNLIYGMVNEVVQGWLNQESRYEGYADTVLDQSGSDELFGSAMRNNAIPPSKLKRVFNEWDEPRHDEFKPRNAWSMFNAFTEVMKSSPRQLPERSIRLHKVFDEFCANEIQDRVTAKSFTDSQLELPNPTYRLNGHNPYQTQGGGYIPQDQDGGHYE